MASYDVNPDAVARCRDLIDAIARLPRVCEDVNLPLQSGDDEVLLRMRRGYTIGFYKELVARIRSILRRTGEAEPESSRLTFEDVELDEDAHEVRRAGTVVDLTATEYRLLRYLMLNPRRVLTRAQLLEHVWDYDFNGDARVLETYVSYLRKKLDAHGPALIHTVRGVGYALRQPRT